MSTENDGAGQPDESAAGARQRADSGMGEATPAGPAPSTAPPTAVPPSPPLPLSAPPTSSAPSTPPPSSMPTAPQSTLSPPPPATAPWTTFAAPPPPPPPPFRRRRGGLIAGVVAVTLVVGGLGGGIGYFVAERGETGGGSPLAATGPDRNVTERAPESVAGIAEATLPSVVTIQAEGDREGGTGTGFVYDEEGHIMTNNHVVTGAGENGDLTVTFSDGESFGAELVGGAAGYDVAVLKLVKAGDRKLEPLSVGDSDAVAVGDATIAIGAPYGLSGTVTTGIVSAKNRPVASSDGQGGSPSYMSALQTDASINPGNSGGPLLDANGAVIGVNSAIQSNPGGLGQGSAGSIGLGFAIPINQAKRVAQDLIETGEPVYAVIGVSVDMGSQTAGALISKEGAGGGDPVPADGPAAAAGLKPGDVIVRFGDRLIDSGPTLISEIWTYEPGSTVEITYERDGRQDTVELTLGEHVGDRQ